MTNYRNVYKSDHLGVVDLEELVDTGKELVFTIKHVKQELGVMVAGTRGNFNIAYFEDNLKPLVLNSTNATTLRRLAGGSINVEDWKNVRVELYIDANVKMKGLVVGGVRIKQTAPQGGVSKQFDNTKAIESLNLCGTLEQLKFAWSGLTNAEQSDKQVMELKEVLKTKLK
jgi:hypothetical protein